MALKRERSLPIFRKLDRQLGKLESKFTPNRVHKFRTSSRRVEAILEAVQATKKRSGKKLLKTLAQLRKKAGRVRDLDVQITALRNLKFPEAAGQKSQLLHVLGERRLRGEHKIAAALNGETVRGLRKRLKRVGAQLEVSPEQLLRLARAGLVDLLGSGSPLDEKALHQYRIKGKRARYLMELAGAKPEARQTVQILKRMQDAIGDWHDWFKLTERAQDLFGGVRESRLVAALHNVTRAKFRQALAALKEASSELTPSSPTPVPATERKAPDREVETPAAA